MPRADVVIDQLESQTTGVFAIEAMALGRPVLTEYRPDLLAPFARRSPVVRTSAATLRDDAVALCTDTTRRAALGEAGRRFVAEVHAAGRVAEALSASTGTPASRPPAATRRWPAASRLSGRGRSLGRAPPKPGRQGSATHRPLVGVREPEGEEDDPGGHDHELGRQGPQVLVERRQAPPRIVNPVATAVAMPSRRQSCGRGVDALAEAPGSCRRRASG